MKFASIQAGDEVIIDPAYDLPIQLHTEDHTTNTQIIVGQWRFRRKDGLRIGDSKLHQAYLMRPTPALLERVQRIDLIRYILSHPHKMDHVPMTTLLFLVSAMKQVIFPKPAAA